MKIAQVFFDLLIVLGSLTALITGVILILAIPVFFATLPDRRRERQKKKELEERLRKEAWQKELWEEKRELWTHEWKKKWQQELWDREKSKWMQEWEEEKEQECEIIKAAWKSDIETQKRELQTILGRYEMLNKRLERLQNRIQMDREEEESTARYWKARQRERRDFLNLWEEAEKKNSPAGIIEKTES